MEEKAPEMMQETIIRKQQSQRQMPEAPDGAVEFYDLLYTCTKLGG